MPSPGAARRPGRHSRRHVPLTPQPLRRCKASYDDHPERADDTDSTRGRPQARPERPSGRGRPSTVRAAGPGLAQRLHRGVVRRSAGRHEPLHRSEATLPRSSNRPSTTIVVPVAHSTPHDAWPALGVTTSWPRRTSPARMSTTVKRWATTLGVRALAGQHAPRRRRRGRRSSTGSFVTQLQAAAGATGPSTRPPASTASTAGTASRRASTTSAREASYDDEAEEADDRDGRTGGRRAGEAGRARDSSTSVSWAVGGGSGSTEVPSPRRPSILATLVGLATLVPPHGRPRRAPRCRWRGRGRRCRRPSSPRPQAFLPPAEKTCVERSGEPW